MNLIEYNSPFGVINIAEQNGAISRVYLPNHHAGTDTADAQCAPLLVEARKQFDEYFSGTRRYFDLPLSFDGCTDFMTRVYHALLEIKYGQTASYKDIAARIGAPKAYRAVGLANNKNILPILVPCHRIIGADGGLTGYAGGLELKARLLELERANINIKIT